MPWPMKRVKGLDGVRGFAILWVLLYHLYALVPKAPWAAIPGLGWFAGYGWMGVSLFFALSGYLIIPMLAEQKGDPHFFGRFWCRRAFRLLPIYVILLLSFLAAVAYWPAASPGRERLLDTAIPFWSYWAFVQNLLMSSRRYMGSEWLRVSWSLAVEIQFYALICLVVYVLPRVALVRWLVALAGGVLLLRYAVVFLNPGASTPLVLLLPSRLDAFLLGGLVALVPARVPGISERKRQWIALALLVASGGAFCWFAAGGFGDRTQYALPTYYLMLSLGSAAFLDLCATSSPVVQWWMESAPMIRAGKLSYFIYLFHLPLAWTIYAVGFGMEPNLQSAKALAVMGACLLAIYGLGELSFRIIEGPLIRRSHAFFSGANG